MYIVVNVNWNYQNINPSIGVPYQLSYALAFSPSLSLAFTYFPSFSHPLEHLPIIWFIVTVIYSYKLTKAFWCGLIKKLSLFY